MSKDKGTKNVKKAPADRSSGTGKTISDYKAEGKGGIAKNPTIEAFVPKTDPKSGGPRK